MLSSATRFGHRDLTQPRSSPGNPGGSSIAALNTVEPPITELSLARILERDSAWYEQRLPVLEERVRKRLAELCRFLGDAEWLDGAFSAGDLLMVSVLLRLKPSGMLEQYPQLSAYVVRGEERPAYQRAFAAQWAVFQAAAGAE